MRTFKGVLEERGIEMPTGEVSGEWFATNGLPMIVHCTTCEETLCVVNALVDDEGYTYCRNCGGIENV